MTKTITINGCKVTIERPDLSPEERKQAEERIKTVLVNYERNRNNEIINR